MKNRGKLNSSINRGSKVGVNQLYDPRANREGTEITVSDLYHIFSQYSFEKMYKLSRMLYLVIIINNMINDQARHLDGFYNNAKHIYQCNI